MVGRTLSHYRILEKIGSGGMGDVYLAEDTKLSRKVALKVLPTELAKDDDRRARFEREAKAVAALSHPNIVTLHSIEESSGVHFMTMELVRGKTLAEVLPRNGYPPEQFFEIAIPLTDGVATAHQRGITHRDLKPSNVMLTDGGQIKMLDFGLAKLNREIRGSGISELETTAATQEGMLVGTLGYMSPEQAEGKSVDHRTDIFALGVVFYELLTGQLPFRGDSPAGVVSSILKDRPRPLSEVNLEIPRDLARIVKRCLEKDTARRFQSALDLRNELEDCKEDLARGEAEDPTAAVHRRGGVLSFASLASALIGGALGFLAGGLVLENRGSLPKLARPRQITAAVGVEAYPTWSPDSSRIAYGAMAGGDNWDIWVSQVSGGPPVNLTPDHDGADMHPSWSPDGAQIAFSSGRDGGGCFVMPSLGGPARKVASFAEPPERGHPVWSSDGEELACLGGSDFLRITRIDSGEFRDLAVPDFPGRLYDVSWSEDGRFFALVEAPSYNSPATRLWLLRESDGEATPLSDGRTNLWGPSFDADGILYYVSNAGGTMDLWRQRLRDDGSPEGPPEAVTVALGLHGRAVVSHDGSKLAFAKGRLVANIWRVPILRDRPATWQDALPLTSEQAHVESLDVCRDRRLLAFSSDRAGSLNLWVMPADGGEPQQRTAHAASDWGPAWSPDCEEIAFHSDRSGNRDIWVVPLEPGPARQLTRRTENDLDPRWSPDGKRLVFSAGPQPAQTWVIDAEGGEPSPLIEDGDRSDDWSPDGRWILYKNHSDGRRWRWSVDGNGNESLGFETRVARWAPDGRHIYYLSPTEDSIWGYAIEDGTKRRVTDLAGRPGKMGPYALATDGTFLYFAWRLDESDIWVMDILPE